MSKPEIRKKKRTSRPEFLESTGVALVAATAGPAIQAHTPGSMSAALPTVPRTAIRLNGANQRLEMKGPWTLVA